MAGVAFDEWATSNGLVDAFVVALVLIAAGLVTAIGITASSLACTTTSFTSTSAGATLIVFTALDLIVFAVVYANARRSVSVAAMSSRMRVRNVIFMLTFGLLATGHWLKWALALVLGCAASAWSVVNLVAAALVVLWFVVVIWTPSLMH